MSETLLPCPWCGGSNLEVKMEAGGHFDRPRDRWVRCIDCNADGPDDGETAWNRRVSLEVAATHLEHLASFRLGTKQTWLDAAAAIRALATRPAQPEPRAAGTAAVVAWLRKKAGRADEKARDDFTRKLGQDCVDAFLEQADDLRDLADAIERGDHLTTESAHDDGKAGT